MNATTAPSVAGPTTPAPTSSLFSALTDAVDEFRSFVTRPTGFGRDPSDGDENVAAGASNSAHVVLEAPHTAGPTPGVVSAFPYTPSECISSTGAFRSPLRTATAANSGASTGTAMGSNSATARTNAAVTLTPQLPESHLSPSQRKANLIRADPTLVHVRLLVGAIVGLTWGESEDGRGGDNGAATENSDIRATDSINAAAQEIRDTALYEAFVDRHLSRDTWEFGVGRRTALQVPKALRRRLPCSTVAAWEIATPTQAVVILQSSSARRAARVTLDIDSNNKIHRIDVKGVVQQITPVKKETSQQQPQSVNGHGADSTLIQQPPPAAHYNSQLQLQACDLSPLEPQANITQQLLQQRQQQQQRNAQDVAQKVSEERDRVAGERERLRALEETRHWMYVSGTVVDYIATEGNITADVGTGTSVGNVSSESDTRHYHIQDSGDHGIGIERGDCIESIDGISIKALMSIANSKGIDEHQHHQQQQQQNPYAPIEGFHIDFGSVDGGSDDGHNKDNDDTNVAPHDTYGIATVIANAIKGPQWAHGSASTIILRRQCYAVSGPVVCWVVASACREPLPTRQGLAIRIIGKATLAQQGAPPTYDHMADAEGGMISDSGRLGSPSVSGATRTRAAEHIPPTSMQTQPHPPHLASAALEAERAKVEGGWHLAQAAAAATAQVNAQAVVIDELRSEIQRMRSERDAAIVESEVTHKSYNDAVARATIEAVTAAEGTVKADAEVNRLMIASLQEQLRSKDTDLTQLREKFDLSESERRVISTALDVSERERAVAVHQRQLIDGEREQHSTTQSLLQSEIIGLKAELVASRALFENTKTELSTSESARSNAESDCRRLEGVVAEQQREMENLNVHIGGLENEIVALRVRVDNDAMLAQTAEEAAAEAGLLVKTMEDLQKELAVVTSERDTLLERYGQFRDEIGVVDRDLAADITNYTYSSSLDSRNHRHEDSTDGAPPSTTVNGVISGRPLPVLSPITRVRAVAAATSIHDIDGQQQQQQQQQQASSQSAGSNGSDSNRQVPPPLPLPPQPRPSDSTQRQQQHGQHHSPMKTVHTSRTFRGDLRSRHDNDDVAGVHGTTIESQYNAAKRAEMAEAMARAPVVLSDERVIGVTSSLDNMEARMQKLFQRIEQRSVRGGEGGTTHIEVGDVIGYVPDTV